MLFFKKHPAGLLAAGAFIFFFTGCKSMYGTAEPKLLDDNTFKLTQVSEDNTYGYIVENPVIVGQKGANESENRHNERRYLNALTGPGGEKVFYKNTGGCCVFKTSNSTFAKTGMLRKYRVTWEGRPDTVTLFLNSFDYGNMMVPAGFGFKK